MAAKVFWILNRHHIKYRYSYYAEIKMLRLTQMQMFYIPPAVFTDNFDQISKI